MKPAEYLKSVITSKQVIFNTMLYLGLSETEFIYIKAAWIYSTTKGNEFCPRELGSILKVLNPRSKHTNRQFRNVICKNLETKGYLKFSYSNKLEKWYSLDKGFNKLFDVIDLFEKAELLRIKKVAGLFGGVYYKTDTYKETRKDINKFLRVLKKEMKKHAKRNKNNHTRRVRRVLS